MIAPMRIVNAVQWVRSRRLRAAQLIWLLCLASSVAFVGFNLINHFFVEGPYLQDTGWYSGLFNSWSINLLNPTAIDGVPPKSYYSTHISPAFQLIGLVTHTLKLPTVVIGFIWFLIIYLVSLASVYWLALRGGSNQALTWISAGIFSAAFVLSSHFQNQINYPHPEILILPLSIGLFWAIQQNITWLLAAFIAGLVALREDMGLHLFGFTSLLTIYFLIKTDGRWSAFLRISFLLFCLSAVEITIQKFFFPSDNALQRIYTGVPPFSHVNASFISDRIRSFWLARFDIILGFSFCVAAAVYRRNLLYLVGIVAPLPWIILNILAFSSNPSTLSLYYGFPILLTLVWPLIVFCFLEPAARQRPMSGPVLLFTGAAAFIASIPQTVSDLSSLYRVSDRVAWRGVIEFEKTLAEMPPELRSKLIVSPSVAALAPNLISNENVSIFSNQNVVASTIAPDKIFLFLPKEFDGKRLASTAINKHFKTFAFGQGPILVAVGPAVEATVRSAFARFVGQANDVAFERAYLKPAVSRVDGAFQIQRAVGHAIFGPYLDLEYGEYSYAFSIRSECRRCTLTLSLTSGGTELKRVDVDLRESSQALNIDFSVGAAGLKDVQFVYSFSRAFRGSVSAVTLRKFPNGN